MAFFCPITTAYFSAIRALSPYVASFSLNLSDYSLESSSYDSKRIQKSQIAVKNRNTQKVEAKNNDLLFSSTNITPDFYFKIK